MLRGFLKPHELRLKSKIPISPVLPRTPIAESPDLVRFFEKSTNQTHGSEVRSSERLSVERAAR
jgi:hypothetical protein